MKTMWTDKSFWYSFHTKKGFSSPSLLKDDTECWRVEKLQGFTWKGRFIYPLFSSLTLDNQEIYVLKTTSKKYSKGYNYVKYCIFDIPKVEFAGQPVIIKKLQAQEISNLSFMYMINDG